MFTKAMKTKRKTVWMLALLLLISGCAKQQISADNSASDLPPLNGDYAYLRVEVISKDKEAKTMKVKVVDFKDYPE